jgi:hypothetical protein
MGQQQGGMGMLFKAIGFDPTELNALVEAAKIGVPKFVTTVNEKIAAVEERQFSMEKKLDFIIENLDLLVQAEFNRTLRETDFLQFAQRESEAQFARNNFDIGIIAGGGNGNGGNSTN